MKIATKVNEFSLKCYLYCHYRLPFLVIGMVLYCFMINESFADGVNRLAGLKSDVSATFGAGSDTQYFILLGEGIGGAYGYMKTKNIMILTGVPILMAFTHWALK